ncbi:MAG: MATE family efflux transporter, partial [Sphaerochaetaceae bacterium]|nr:MATE family efflux transporter [Sphaerochaetaceae bacterium]
MFSGQFIFGLVFPLLVEHVLNLSIGIADTMMLASSGEAQVGGASLITAVSNLFFALFQAFATGGAVVVS